MSTIHDAQTQILTPPPGKPGKKWHQRWQNADGAAVRKFRRTGSAK